MMANQFNLCIHQKKIIKAKDRKKFRKPQIHLS